MNINRITYNEQYNPYFRPISNTKIITVEISPTGSGKTFFYRNSPNTIMIMPTNSIVRQNNGMIAYDKAREGERSKWEELRTDRCDYMTYDKFFGHSQFEDLSNFNIIIDEAHLLFSSDSENHYKLLKALFLREFEYKELKIITATIRPEVLKLYSIQESLNVNQYVKEVYNPVINFTPKIPDILPSQRTIFFINSIDKILQAENFYRNLYPEIRTRIITAQEDLPDANSFDEYDLILATSSIKQGFSINAHIDKIIIHNVHNSVGSLDIVQYMSRPRNNTPITYVVFAKTHFTMTQYLQKPNLDYLWRYLHRNHELTDEEYQANNTIEINKFLARAKSELSSWNVLGVVNYYEEKLKDCEVYALNGEVMRESLIELIPSANINFNIPESKNSPDFRSDLVFRPLDYDVNTLRECANLRELREQLNFISENATDRRILNKVNKMLKVEPVTEFNFINKKGEKEIYVFLDEVIIEQVLDSEIYKRCKQHVKNIENNIYAFRDKQDKRYLPQIGILYDVEKKLTRKLKFIRGHFKTKAEIGGADIVTIKLLYKLYSYTAYSYSGRQIKPNRFEDIDEVKITNDYPVEKTWYKKVNMDGVFLRVDYSKLK